jgi:putative transposase
VDGLANRRASEPSPDAARKQSRTQQIFGWFHRTLSESFFAALKQDLEIVENSCIFTLPVTTWLMIMQRLSPRGTLATAVSELLQGNGRELLQPCKQVREGRISANTGAYSQARQRVPQEALRRVAQRTFEYLHQLAPKGGIRDRLFLLDGSSIRLAHSPAIIKRYPPAQNQNGESHWPVLRVAVMHHVITAMAMAPEFGPMYGREAVGEQEVAEPLIARLPSASVLMADRNFGVFSVVWCAHHRGHAVVVRMTEPRAKRLSGGDLPLDSDCKVTWQPSRDDIRAHPELTADAQIEGRLIVVWPEGMQERLCLFTTLQEPAAEVVALYKERWHIETDLRSLKDQIRLHTIPARSPDLMAGELFIAVASYNLIRSVMAEAAEPIGIEPRRLSFSRSREAFWAFARAVAAVDPRQKFEEHWQVLMRALSQSKLPNRPRRTAPRAVWPRPQHFPARKVQNNASKI